MGEDFHRRGGRAPLPAEVEAVSDRQRKLEHRQRERARWEATRETIRRLLTVTRRCRTGKEFAAALVELWGAREQEPPGPDYRALAATPLAERPREIARRFDRLVPEPVRRVLGGLAEHGYAAFLVGGCVRDLLLARAPKDWDVATSARPEEVRRIFRRTIPTGIEHGTVTVRTGGLGVEVTTFRREGRYSDHRHPDEVEFTQDLREDLERRDLTINALALDHRGQLHDPLGGLEDLVRGVVRAVGDPEERFNEDALRLLRVVRFAARFGYTIEPRTEAALARCAGLIRHISWERIREEMSATLLTARPAWALNVLRLSGLLDHIWPELLEGVGVAQNVHHAYTVWEHNLLACEYTPPVLRLRLAGLLHDVGKPRTVSEDDSGERHFYHHEVVGAEMAREMLRRLRYDNDTVERVTHLVRHHLALHHYPGMTDAAIRRLIRRIGPEYLEDLIILRVADRAASGTKQAPISRGAYRLLTRMEKVLAEDAAFSLHDLAIDGHDVMEATGFGPGPAIGWLLQQLLEEVLDDPARNQREILLRRAQELAPLAEERFAVTRRG